MKKFFQSIFEYFILFFIYGGVYFIIECVIGGLLGALLLSKISNNLIHKIFGVVIIASAVRMLII